jgi:hypothetical protein
MKITATSTFDTLEEFETTKTALVGVGDNNYAATKAQFRRLFKAPKNLGITLSYGVHRTQRGTLGNCSAFAYHTKAAAHFGCMTFVGRDLIRLRRWALRKVKP